MRSLLISYLEFVFNLLSLTRSVSQTQPEFCATQHFDGVYYIGWNLTFKSGKQFWRFDNSIRRTVPYSPDPSKVTTTSLFINRVLDCSLNPDCEQMKKAFDLLFTRRTVISTSEEITDVFRVKSYEQLEYVHPNEYPWKLKDPHIIWPLGWDKEPKGSRASLFIPKTNVVLFIDNKQDSIELHFHTIDSSNWFVSMHVNLLDSGVVFTGMFHTFATTTNDGLTARLNLAENSVYAVGHDTNDPNKKSKLFYLKKDMTFAYDVSFVSKNF